MAAVVGAVAHAVHVAHAALARVALVHAALAKNSEKEKATISR